jgi:hypothetical protein
MLPRLEDQLSPVVEMAPDISAANLTKRKTAQPAIAAKAVQILFSLSGSHPNPPTQIKPEITIDP